MHIRLGFGNRRRVAGIQVCAQRGLEPVDLFELAQDVRERQGNGSLASPLLGQLDFVLEQQLGFAPLVFFVKNFLVMLLEAAKGAAARLFFFQGRELPLERFDRRGGGAARLPGPRAWA